MNDKVFGELTYDGGWTRTINIDFWGKHQTLKLIISAYENEMPNLEQQEAYSRFLEDYESISNLSLKKMKQYIDIIEDDVLEYCELQKIPEDISEILHINKLLFLENGSIGIICDAKWDSHGVAVLCTETEVKAGPLEIVWYE